MPTLRKTIELSAPQMAFRKSQAPIRGLVGGIGSGKSWIASYDLLRRAKPGRLYLMLAPNFRMLRDASWRSLKEIARSLHFLRSENKTEMLLRLGNGAEILGRSADDPDGLRGPNVSGIVGDEASLMLEAVFDIALGRLREGGEDGWISLAFTPRGKRHWTYRVLQGDDAELFKAPTKSNPKVSRTWLNRLENRYSPQWARQELEGEFVEIEGAEFSAAWFGEHAWFEKWPDNLILKTLALDPSKGKSDRVGDFSAYAKVGIGADDVIYVQADLDRRPIDRMIDEGVEHYRTFGPHAFGIEGNAWQDLLAQPFGDAFRRADVLAPPLRLIDNRVNKVVRIRRLGEWLSQGRMRFKKDCAGTQLLVDQLMDFPEGVHDDGPDALEMGVRMALEMAGIPVGG